MSVVTINLNFFKDGEFGMEVFLNKFGDLFRWSCFLAKELIAWESKDLKSFRFELIVHFDHGFIVGGSESSLACYIDNHNSFFVFEGGEIDQLPSDILDFEIEEGLAGWRELLGSFFKEDSAHVFN